MDNDSLSQDEIDALLNSMSSENASPSPDDAQGTSQPKPLLSQEELDTLLNAASSTQGAASDGADTIITLSGRNAASSKYKDISIEKYDFTMPSRVSRDHVRALRALHNSYARALSSSLSMSLRAVVEIDCTHIEQLTYGEYLASLLEPSCIGVFSMKSLKGLGAIELNPPLVFPIIDKLLGGPGAARFYNRTLTTIEEMVITKVMKEALNILKESWQRSMELDMTLDRIENNPQFVQAASNADPVILILFDFRLDEVHSMMSICFPFISIQQALASLRREEFPTVMDNETTELYKGMVRKHLDALDVVVSARYETSAVSIRELMELQKGDIIKLQNADKDIAEIFVSGQKKYHAKPGMSNGRRAIQIYDPEKKDKTD